MHWDRCALDALGAHCERLRGQMLQGLRNSHALAGLGILMGQGMRAWMENCRECARAIGGSGADEPPPLSIPSSLQTQVVRVIASMVWNRERKEPS
jgi:hypothetical protein